MRGHYKFREYAWIHLESHGGLTSSITFKNTGSKGTTIFVLHPAEVILKVIPFWSYLDP